MPSMHAVLHANCPRCLGSGYVCLVHPEKAHAPSLPRLRFYPHAHVCYCGAERMPCPVGQLLPPIAASPLTIECCFGGSVPVVLPRNRVQNRVRSDRGHDRTKRQRGLYDVMTV